MQGCSASINTQLTRPSDFSTHPPSASTPPPCAAAPPPLDLPVDLQLLGLPIDLQPLGLPVDLQPRLRLVRLYLVFLLGACEFYPSCRYGCSIA